MQPAMKRLEELGRRVGEEQAQVADQIADLESMRRELLDQLAHAPRSRSPDRRRMVAVVAIAAVLACLALVIAWPKSTPALAYQVSGTQVDPLTRWIAAPDGQPVRVDFSDGSRIVLEPRARSRIVAVHANGADVVLESGRGNFAIVPHRDAHWQVVLGPFTVHVTGTRFDASWDPVAELFELTLHEGKVTISGCEFGNGRDMHVGDHVQASCRGALVEIPHDVPPSAPSASAQAADQRPRAPASPGPRADDAGSPSAESTPPRAASWQELASRGRYREAFAAAEAEGFDSASNRAAAPDLLALANAARLSGRLDRASTAYRLLRQRFPGDSRASLAAFELARMAFDQRGDYAGAAQWFGTYLRERPSGPLAREAHGRLIEALQRAGNLTAARGEAERYLRVYPNGPHRELAERLVEPASSRTSDRD